MKNLLPYSQLHTLIGKEVSVHWHFRKKCYSVKLNGKVVAHLTDVALEDVRFKVSAAGRERVRREKVKNVHAHVIGTLRNFDGHLPGYNGRTPFALMYNPYRNEGFVIRDSAVMPDRVVVSAHAALLGRTGGEPHPTMTAYTPSFVQ